MNRNKYFNRLIGILFFVIPSLAFAQKDYTFEFGGFLRLSEGQSISYKIHFNKLENNEIVGISITDFLGTEYTVSTIEGTFDDKKKELSFREISNLSTKSNEADSIFCYVKCEDLKGSKLKGNLVLNGNFEGLFPNGKRCANGIIQLISLDLLEDINKKLLSSDIQNDTLDRIKSLLKIAQSSNAKVLTKNQTLAASCDSSTVSIKFWDAKKLDNDKISVELNEQFLAKELVVQAEKTIFNLTDFSDKGLLKIKALDEGLQPPNTVNAQLSGCNYQSPFVIYFKTNDEVFIELSRGKP